MCQALSKRLALVPNRAVNITDTSNKSLLKSLKSNEFLRKTSNCKLTKNSMIIAIVLKPINSNAGF